MNCTDDHDAAVCTTSDDAVDNNVNDIKFAIIERERDNDATTYLIEKIRRSVDFDTTVCVSTKTSRKDPTRLSQAVVLFSTEDSPPVIKDNVPKDEVDSSFSTNDIDNSCFDIGIKFSQRDNRLIIESVSNTSIGWFSSMGCAIKKGDIVVGINEYITSTMSPEQANVLLFAIVSSRTTSMNDPV